MDGGIIEQGQPDVALGHAASGKTGLGLASLPPLPPHPDAGATLRLAAWLALLLVGYGLQRGLCAVGLPYDCDSVDGADAFTTLTLLAFTGGGLGWLVGATQPARFAWLAAPRRSYLWAVYLAVFPCYSALSNIPALQASLAGGSFSPAFLGLCLAVGAVGLAALAFHCWLAAQPPPSGMHSSSSMHSSDSWRPPSAADSEAAAVASEAGGSPHWTLSADPPAGGLRPASRSQLLPQAGGGGGGGASTGADGSGGGKLVRGTTPAWRWRQRRRALAIYLLPRLLVLGYFAAWLVALPLSGDYFLHLHHYALGWAAACFAAFNHPLSGLLLAFGTAVFVQGGAAYGFDALFKPSARPPGGCLPVSSNSTGQMVCAFWSAQPFHLSFCSNTSWIPWFDCTVPWPWPDTDLSHAASMSLLGGGAGPAAAAPAATAFPAAAPAQEPLL